MIKNYFIIAFRTLLKQKSLTLINILGLSTGLTCFILFVVYGLNEFSYNRFHADKKNIYRVFRNVQMENGEFNSSSFLPIPLGPAIKNELPGVKNYVRFSQVWNGSYVRIDGKVNRVPFDFADPSIFSVFTFPFKYGNTQTALKDKHSVVVTEKIAKLLFAQENPVGKKIEVKIEDDFEPFTITGVCEDIPSNSSISFGMLASFERYLDTKSGKIGENQWQRAGNPTYVQLTEGNTLPTKAELLKKFYGNHHKGENAKSYYGLLNIEHLHSNAIGGDDIDPKNVYILLSIALGILIIACINFTTLAIGRSAGRAKEVGVRKVIGGSKRGLVLQFLTESLILTFISASISLLAVKYLMPLFNQLADQKIELSFKQFPELPWLLLAITILVGLLAGSYPALVLSAFKPIDVLKKKLKLSGTNLFTRSLVTFQFVLSIALMISTIIILQQLNFMRSKNPGFNKENVLVVDAENVDTKKVYPLFRESLIRETGIKGIASAELSMGEGMGYSSTSFGYEGKQKSVYEYYIDPYYLNVMGIPLLAGRNFDPKLSSDSTAIIINETMMKDFGWTLKNAVGQPIKEYSETFTPVVIGVIKDINFRNMRQKIEPQLFQQFAGYASYRYLVRLEPGDPSVTIAKIEKRWKELVPDLPLTYSFMDEDLDKFYKSEERWGNIIGLAGGLSIFLACLGLFGLAALSAINRTKEIGIRKVLGASLLNITQLLSKDFIKLICVAIIIAAPITWYFMDIWLRDFAYRIHVNWLIFIGVGIVAITVAIITISFQSIKAAITSPVKNLRTE